MGKIAGYLPPRPGTGWAREDVWEDSADGGGCGDYAVGKVYSVRYTYTLPCGTHRLCMDEEYFVEPCPEDDPKREEADEFTVMNKYEIREERKKEGDWQETNIIDSGFDYGSVLVQYSLSQAEDTARQLALCDNRNIMLPSAKF